MIVTEQYPKGLGSTVQELDLTGVKLVVPKTRFSMVLPEVEAALAEIPGVRSVVLFGVEVCGTVFVSFSVNENKRYKKYSDDHYSAVPYALLYRRFSTWMLRVATSLLHRC